MTKSPEMAIETIQSLSRESDPRRVQSAISPTSIRTNSLITGEDDSPFHEETNHPITEPPATISPEGAAIDSALITKITTAATQARASPLTTPTSSTTAPDSPALIIKTLGEKQLSASHTNIITAVGNDDQKQASTPPTNKSTAVGNDNQMQSSAPLANKNMAAGKDDKTQLSAPLTNINTAVGNENEMQSSASVTNKNMVAGNSPMQSSTPLSNKNTAVGNDDQMHSTVPLTNKNITAEKDEKIQLSTSFKNKFMAAGGENILPLAPLTNKTMAAGKEASSAPVTNKNIAAGKDVKTPVPLNNKNKAAGEDIQPSSSAGTRPFSLHPRAESESSPTVFDKSHNGNGILKQRQDPDDVIESDVGAVRDETTDADIDGGVAVVWALTGIALALALIWLGKELKRLWDLRVEMMLQYPEGPPPS